MFKLYLSVILLSLTACGKAPNNFCINPQVYTGCDETMLQSNSLNQCMDLIGWQARYASDKQTEDMADASSIKAQILDPFYNRCNDIQNKVK